MCDNNELPIAITPGEPAGIGPDILLMLLQQPMDIPLLIFADQSLLEQRAKTLGIPFYLPSTTSIQQTPLAGLCNTGNPNINNANYVIETIQQATQACMEKRCRALVTGPVHKGVINEAGITFTGHTELLATLTNTKHTVMMLTNAQLKIALATTHLPLSQVPQAITEERLTKCIEIIEKDCQTRFDIESPRILVCGLNPHAGENGHLGTEEQSVIIPCLQKLREKGYQLIGPVSADTAFTSQSLSQCDIVLAMYHDQGLPVLKSQGFGQAVNITLGLPIIRTSVDHGVALTLAGTGKASHSSLQIALQMANTLSQPQMARL